MPAKPLRFLADESLEYPVVIYLRKKGCSVLSIAENSPSISDKSVLKKAFLQKRIILTNDKDFGDLIFLSKLPHKGVILFRIKSENIQNKIEACKILLKNYKDKLVDNFIVVKDGRIRVKPKPKPAYQN